MKFANYLNKILKFIKSDVFIVTARHRQINCQIFPYIFQCVLQDISQFTTAFSILIISMFNFDISVNFILFVN